MRRPPPTPTPPQPEPGDAAAEERARAARVSADVTESVADPDAVDTAVDVVTLEEWAQAPSGTPARPARLLRPRPHRGDEERASAEEPPKTPTSDAGDDAPVAKSDVRRAERARRRSLRAEVKRFTVRSRRRRLAWIVAIAAVLVVGVGSFAAAYSPLFAVQTVTVEGATTLDAAAIGKALDAQQGVPLAAVDASAIKAALVAFPGIETYAIEARPPHELVVRIVERTPVGVVESPAGYSLVDAAGVVLSTTTEVPAGQPVITAAGGLGSPAFQSAGLVIRALPAAVRAQLTEVSATTPNDVTLQLGSVGASVVWGSEDESVKKAIVLEKIMAAHPPAGSTTYDVSSPDAVVVR